MATDDTANKKKSKFGGFKNGLNKMKNSMNKKRNSVDATNGSDAASSSKSSKSSNKHSRKISFTKNKPIKDRPKLPQLSLDGYSFPSQIFPPSECWGDLQYDDDDVKLQQYLLTKYKKEIESLKFFPSDVLIRFTLSQRGLTPFSERQNETEAHFTNYLKFHVQHHYDDILVNDGLNASNSLTDLQTDIHALSLFIYGQDKEGHPVIWDDGTAYSKDAKLGIFKHDMKRCRMFRSRIMRRVHNLKLSASQRYGRMIYKHCLVMDLAKFNAKQFVKDRTFHQINTKELTDLFPECMHRLYIINAPWAFRSAWKVIQTFMHPITVEKTKILGKDYIDELQRDINLDMIPFAFGGIGPWEIEYGAEPSQYTLCSSNSDFDYNKLPKNELPVPKRTAAPDMNKHRAKQQKQLKMNGIKDNGDIGDILVIEDNEDDEKLNDNDDDAEENVAAQLAQFAVDDDDDVNQANNEPKTEQQ
mmetsp:Transcript_10813/g.16280  ORF Transcript_10813/g.16280 Transcript_10813/m.16280 type:complete len:472 (-) Transcript_10813:179-1594(-)|eukprot:CAMPEP_0202690346 /NCGR_PEP_ID=MMETSP1385-20130828/5350_1 /ASSEMBLY_ACC=CAM_ASM_000861 /TAXON_ID=933848 /ORGANISM="Elphidium margaritaceum" /LENGTH=471 /DNA_ID=CAMNT_0049345597 /DNA_START=82 /DNA_END=1497 /DNA_ORIENTATION=+